MDRFDYYFRQNVTEAELDDGFDACEVADRNMIVDQGLVGRNFGLVATETSPTPAISIDVSAGAAYDQTGRRIALDSPETVDVSVDSSSVSTAVVNPGNTKIVSVFIEFQRLLTDPRIDGNNDTVFFNRAEDSAFFIKQGAESAGTPTPPALESGRLLLCDITLSYGQTQILDANISFARREDLIKIADKTTTPGISEGTIEEAFDAVLDTIESVVTGPLVPEVQIFITGGTWTKPAGAVWSQLMAIGGGGGGGGVSGGGSRGGGGGGASGSLQFRSIQSALLEASLPVTVGSGGGGGSTGGSNGGSGSPSFIGGVPGTYILAQGGGGGTGSTTTTGGAGGAINNQYGAYEAYGGGGADTGAGAGAAGGAGYTGSRGAGGATQTGGGGGLGYGAGGGGAANDTGVSSGGGGGGGGGYGYNAGGADAEDGQSADGAAGGAGADGLVVVTTWKQPVAI